MKASVKVMRSYDYCHFEIVLGTNDDEEWDLKKVDEMRKEAARLVDKAVKQYAIAKKMAENRERLLSEKRYLEQKVEEIKNKPESEWTAEQRAIIKQLQDEEYWNRHQYDYEDEYDEDDDYIYY